MEGDPGIEPGSNRTVDTHYNSQCWLSAGSEGSSKMMTERERFVAYAMTFLHQWYRWGGDDPSGFDCSGFVIECCKAWGLLPRHGDWTADGLWRRWKEDQETYEIVPRAGCLVFFGAHSATHIEIAINSWQTIGASGGGSRTLTIEDAIRDNAFIKVRPINSRSDLLGYVDLFK